MTSCHQFKLKTSGPSVSVSSEPGFGSNLIGGRKDSGPRAIHHNLDVVADTWLCEPAKQMCHRAADI